MMALAATVPTSRVALDFLRRLVYSDAAIVLEANKDYLIEARLSSVLLDEGLPSLDALMQRLGGRDGSSLRQRVVEAMTTNETSFFRDRLPFEAMRMHVLPQLAPRIKDRALSIWSAASSTGQEAYSLTMLLADLPHLRGGRPPELLGTDLSTEVLARARAACYSQLEVNRGLTAAQLVRFFDKTGADWTIKNELRRQVQFRQMNLTQPLPSLPRMDVVFLRNVLIYFDVETKRRVLERVARVMEPGGFLFLGGVESTMGLCDRFTPISVARTTVYQLQP